MLSKHTRLDHIELTAGNAVQIRFALVVADNNNELSVKYHRTGFPVGTDIDAQFELVNSHIAELGYPAIDESGIQKLKNIVSAL